MTKRMIVEQDVEMQTRDGVTLRADIMRPDTDEPVPAIVVRTPYDKTHNFTDRPGFLTPWTAAGAGFAVVVQDIRGRFASDGQWDFKELREVEGRDGLDCLDWVASESWCDGNIGMSGGSYLAETQFAAAAVAPPSLKAIAPSLTGMGADRMRAQKAHLESLMVSYMAFLAIGELERRMGAGEPVDMADLARVMNAVNRPWEEANTLPLVDLLAMKTADMPDYYELDDFLKKATPREGRGEDTFGVPSLWTFGIFDGTGGTEGYEAVRKVGATEAAREGTHLVLGPWTHTHTSNFVGEVGLGAMAGPAEAGIPDIHLDFYRKYVQGDDVDVAKVTYFLLGANTWNTAEDWPVPGTVPTRMFLGSQGRANSFRGDGSLAFDGDASASAHDTYRYDPMDPVPSWGFRIMYAGGRTLAGPYDQRKVEEREDVLCYSSEPMQAPTSVIGDVELHLWVASDAPDTDFVAKLCDVAPDGTSRNVADGYVRARYREAWDRETLLEPGEPTKLTILLGQTANEFAPGHRIRVQLTSSAFPHYPRNLNTAVAPELQEEPFVATQTVFHDAQRPSYVVLPILRDA